MIDGKRQLLERLASEGKACRLFDEELVSAKILEAEGLLFLIGMAAVVTPKGRRRLAELERSSKPIKKPFDFLD